jgi:hypothetical protein
MLRGAGFSVHPKSSIFRASFISFLIADLNIPIAGVAFALITSFLTLPTPPGSMQEKFAKVDWMYVFLSTSHLRLLIPNNIYQISGNFLVMASTCSCVIALTWAGVTYPWNSARVLLPLIVGVTGLFTFMVYEAKLARHPIVCDTMLLPGHMTTLFYRSHSSCYPIEPVLAGKLLMFCCLSFR